MRIRKVLRLVRSRSRRGSRSCRAARRCSGFDHALADALLSEWKFRTGLRRRAGAVGARHEVDAVRCRFRSGVSPVRTVERIMFRASSFDGLFLAERRGLRSWLGHLLLRQRGSVVSPGVTTLWETRKVRSAAEATCWHQRRSAAEISWILISGPLGRAVAAVMSWERGGARRRMGSGCGASTTAPARWAGAMTVAGPSNGCGGSTAAGTALAGGVGGIAHPITVPQKINNAANAFIR